MVKIKNKNLIKSILVTLSLVLTLSFGLVLFKDNVNVVKADSDYQIVLDSQVNKVTSSSSPPIITRSYFDYTSSNFVNKIDYFTTSICNFSGTAVSYALRTTIDTSFSTTNSLYFNKLCSLNSDGSISSISLGARNCNFTHFTTQSDTNVDFVSVYSDNSGISNLLKDFKLSIIVFCDGSSGKYFTIATPQLSNLYYSYNAGISAVIDNPSDYGLYTQEEYDNSYNAGISAVIDNPSDYGLYTQEEYNNSYNVGYNAGYINGQNEVINNPSSYNLFTQSEYNNSYSTGYTDGYESAQNDFTGLGIFSYVTYYNYAKGYGYNADYLISSGRFNSDNVTYYNGGFYNNKTLKDELEDYLDDNSSDYNGGYLSLIFDSPISTTRYYNFVTRGFEFGNSIYFYFDDNTTLNYNRADSFNIDTINFLNLNKNIIKIDLNFANADYLVVGLSANTLVEDSYNTGYNDGKKSVDTTIYYSNGYNTGYNNGKNDGIEAANNYSFLSLIGSVVDAPIKAFTGLFNFDLLGFNLLNFVKALFTLTVIIVVARFVLAKM